MVNHHHHHHPVSKRKCFLMANSATGLHSHRPAPALPPVLDSSRNPCSTRKAFHPLRQLLMLCFCSVLGNAQQILETSRNNNPHSLQPLSFADGKEYGFPRQQTKPDFSLFSHPKKGGLTGRHQSTLGLSSGKLGRPSDGQYIARKESRKEAPRLPFQQTLSSPSSPSAPPSGKATFPSKDTQLRTRQELRWRRPLRSNTGKGLTMKSRNAAKVINQKTTAPPSTSLSPPASRPLPALAPTYPLSKEHDVSALPDADVATSTYNGRWSGGAMLSRISSSDHPEAFTLPASSRLQSLGSSQSPLSLSVAKDLLSASERRASEHAPLSSTSRAASKPLSFSAPPQFASHSRGDSSPEKQPQKRRQRRDKSPSTVFSKTGSRIASSRREKERHHSKRGTGERALAKRRMTREGNSRRAKWSAPKFVRVLRAAPLGSKGTRRHSGLSISAEPLRSRMVESGGTASPLPKLFPAEERKSSQKGQKKVISQISWPSGTPKLGSNVSLFTLREGGRPKGPMTLKLKRKPQKNGTRSNSLRRNNTLPSLKPVHDPSNLLFERVRSNENLGRLISQGLPRSLRSLGRRGRVGIGKKSGKTLTGERGSGVRRGIKMYKKWEKRRKGLSGQKERGQGRKRVGRQSGSGKKNKKSARKAIRRPARSKKGGAHPRALTGGASARKEWRQQPSKQRTGSVVMIREKTNGGGSVSNIGSVNIGKVRIHNRPGEARFSLRGFFKQGKDSHVKTLDIDPISALNRDLSSGKAASTAVAATKYRSQLERLREEKMREMEAARQANEEAWSAIRRARQAIRDSRAAERRAKRNAARLEGQLAKAVEIEALATFEDALFGSGFTFYEDGSTDSKRNQKVITERRLGTRRSSLDSELELGRPRRGAENVEGKGKAAEGVLQLLNGSPSSSGVEQRENWSFEKRIRSVGGRQKEHGSNTVREGGLFKKVGSGGLSSGESLSERLEEGLGKKLKLDVFGGGMAGLLRPSGRKEERGNGNSGFLGSSGTSNGVLKKDEGGFLQPRDIHPQSNSGSIKPFKSGFPKKAESEEEHIVDQHLQPAAATTEGHYVVVADTTGWTPPPSYADHTSTESLPSHEYMTQSYPNSSSMYSVSSSGEVLQQPQQQAESSSSVIDKHSSVTAPPQYIEVSHADYHIPTSNGQLGMPQTHRKLQGSRGLKRKRNITSGVNGKRGKKLPTRKEYGEVPQLLTGKDASTKGANVTQISRKDKRRRKEGGERRDTSRKFFSGDKKLKQRQQRRERSRLFGGRSGDEVNPSTTKTYF